MNFAINQDLNKDAIEGGDERCYHRKNFDAFRLAAPKNLKP